MHNTNTHNNIIQCNTTYIQERGQELKAFEAPTRYK